MKREGRLEFMPDASACTKILTYEFPLPRILLQISIFSGIRSGYTSLSPLRDKLHLSTDYVGGAV